MATVRTIPSIQLVEFELDVRAYELCRSGRMAQRGCLAPSAEGMKGDTSSFRGLCKSVVGAFRLLAFHFDLVIGEC